MPPAGGWSLTNQTRTYGPVTVTAEAMAEAQRQIGALARLPLMLTKWLTQPSVFVNPLKVKYESEASGHIEARLGYDFQREYLGQWVDPPVCGRCRRPLVRESMVSGSDRCRACSDKEKAANARDAARLAEYQAARADPLDVEYDGVKLRPARLQRDAGADQLRIAAGSTLDPRSARRGLRPLERPASRQGRRQRRGRQGARTSVVVDLEEP
jgi:hypothetical protein